jgi:hypothetical protein
VRSPYEEVEYRRRTFALVCVRIAGRLAEQQSELLPSAWNSNRPSIKRYFLHNALYVERPAYACRPDVMPSIFCRE